MKKVLLYLMIFATLPAMAQYRGHGGHGDNHHPGQHGYQNQATSLTVVAPRNQTFWLFVNDVLQNENSVHSIQINNIWPDEYYIRVELDNREQICVGKFVDLRRPQGISIVEHRDLYGFESAQGNIRPELVMDLFVGNMPPVEPQQPFPHHEVAMPVPVPPMPPMPPVPPVQPEPVGMSQADFDEAYAMIQRESFDETRLTIAKQVVAANPMTVNQIAQIAKLFSFESNRLEFAKYVYRYCIDKNKYYAIYEVFDFDSSKQELNEYIQQQ